MISRGGCMPRRKLLLREWKYITGKNPCHVLILQSSTGHYWWITTFDSSKRSRGETVFSIEHFPTIKKCFENFKSIMELCKAVPMRVRNETKGAVARNRRQVSRTVSRSRVR
jgi:hypothetical protein